MSKKSMFARVAALIMAVMVGAAASGCGAEESSEMVPGARTENTSSSPSEAEQSDTLDENGRGRYVETIVYEGKGFPSMTQAQTLGDGRLLFLNCLSRQKVVSEDGGSTWDSGMDDAFAAFIEEHYAASAAVAQDGTLAVIGMDQVGSLPDGTKEYVFNLYIYNTDNTSKQIAINLPDSGSALRTVAFDEQGMLYVYASGCRDIYKVDVGTQTSEKLVTLGAGTDLMECRDHILMCMTDQKIFLYDLEQKCFIEDETLDRFVEENYKELQWTGGGYTAYAFLGADNTIYVAGDKGLYRHIIGGGVVEQVIDGGLSSLSDPSNSIVAMTMNDRNEFLAAYSNGKIVRFAYDAAVSTVPNERICVYGLKEDDLVRQTISAYQTQYPDLYIEYQIGMDEGSVTREDALKKLNTQLLGGSGPDIIMLDGLNIDTYARKGVLMDLTDIVSKVDEQDGLYRNLIENLAVEGTIYAVPAKFYIPVLYGKGDYVNEVKDYPSMADMVERARSEYPDTNLLEVCSAKGIIKRSMPVCAPSWKDDGGQLDQAKVREFLEQTRRIYDAQMKGTPQEEIMSYQQHLIGKDGISYEDSDYFMIARDSSYLMQESPFAYGEIMDAYVYRDLLSVPGIPGLENTVIRPMGGQDNNVYHPASLIGINAASNHIDAAKEFVSMMLGASVQESMQLGIPVNKKALPAQFAYDESELGEDGGQFYEGFSTKDGKSVHYTIYPVNQDGIDRLEQWIAELETPYLSDSVLEDVVYTEGARYLEGLQDIDETLQAITDSAGIYLYE